MGDDADGQDDEDGLIGSSTFAPGMIDAWIDVKRRDEIDFIRLRPHPGEFSLYFNI